MIIKFTKGDLTARSKIICTRTDGSFTGASRHPGIELHDIIHYAVETILEFKQGFYGILDQGFQIEDFELPRHIRPAALIPSNLPIESIQSELLVNQLTMEVLQNPIEDFMEVFKKALEVNKLPFPDRLNESTLSKIRNLIDVIKNQWADIEEGKSMELIF
ncbi:MAG: hypothetical protein ABI761_15185 [Saprospiraceae bacterium]